MGWKHAATSERETEFVVLSENHSGMIGAVVGCSLLVPGKNEIPYRSTTG
ncbi:protein of unknown function [Mesotoga infera]|uniref:Uncharacterized protein n=1 Tax=Mesotoga infera TaxID=1236046 RepID=A0A7Z7LHK2_9BACT|nr:protein of unknown function [Mesotoga infera]